MKHILLIFILFIAGITTASAQREDCQGCGNVGTKYSTNTNNPSNAQVAVFPNPFTEYISVKDNDNQVNQVVLYSITGKKVRVIEDVDSNERYYLNDLQNGMYLVQLIGKNNKIITTQRINKR
jgi:hypothetical protein